MKKKQIAYQKKGINSKSEDMSKWYNDVVLRADLAEYSPVKGCMVIKANAYALWEKVRLVLDAWIGEDGVKNYYFPLLIPFHLLKKEKQHVKGFSPELAVVTHAGGEKLHEPYVIRPTSETIMYAAFSKWISSYRDLPLKVNQWCNVMRWEKRTYPFLRTNEFLWQEGHTAHQTEKEAVIMARKALTWYERFYKEYFAISSYVGFKSEQEKFAGAKTTYSVELIIPNGKALQGATSHNLSDNFSRVFGITFRDKKGKERYVFQTSWGLSTRAIGALVLIHGDDAGLIMPPKVAKPCVVIISISDNLSKAKKINPYIKNIVSDLQHKKIDVVVDADTNHSLGYRINEWEIKGVPLRLEIGAREVQNKTITMVRRDTFEKRAIERGRLVREVSRTLRGIQNNMLKKSERIKNELTMEAKNYKEFRDLAGDEKRFIRAFWCEDKICENKIKAETKLCTRVLELDEIEKKYRGKCIYCGKRSQHKWLFAQSY